MHVDFRWRSRAGAQGRRTLGPPMQVHKLKFIDSLQLRIGKNDMRKQKIIETAPQNCNLDRFQGLLIRFA